MNSKKRIKYDFSKAASIYDSHASFQKKVAKNMFDNMRKIIGTNRVNILDGGCGTGFLKEFIQQEKCNNFYNIVECDIAFGMCRHTLDKLGLNNSVVNADVDYLPFADQSFNVIFSSMVLQWSEHVSSAINEFYRVASSGSYIFISIVSSNSLYELNKSSLKVDGVERVHSFLSQSELVSSLQDIGVRDYLIEEQHYVEYYPDVLSIMRYLKSIGARYKPNNTHYIPNRGFVEQLQNAYSIGYGTPKGLPLTWNIINLVVRKK